jgi:hypothetical protein
VSSVTPGGGPLAGGITVTIGGARLSSTFSVTIGGTAATIGTVTATSVTVTAPAHDAGYADVMVSAPNGTTTASCAFRYMAAPSAPTFVDSYTTSSTEIRVSWLTVTDASYYQVFRRSAGTGFVMIGASSGSTYTDTVTPNDAYLYRVRAVNYGGTSPDSAQHLGIAIVFSDGHLSAGKVIKTQHLVELRTAVNSVRALAGIAPAGFTDAAVPGTTIRAVHINELRSALDPARAALGLPPVMYTGVPGAGVVVRAVQFQELRLACGDYNT